MVHTNICSTLGRKILFRLYLDKINVYRRNFEDHLQYSSEVFKRLIKANLKLKLRKYNFFIFGQIILASILNFCNILNLSLIF